MGLQFLVDEDTNDGQVVTTLKSLGHGVLRAPEVIGAGAPDRVVADYAESTGAIVLTRNWGDFWKILKRQPDRQEHRRYRRAGLLGSRCKNNLALLRWRLEIFTPLLEFEFNEVQEKEDGRLIAEIWADRVLIHR